MTTYMWVLWESTFSLDTGVNLVFIKLGNISTHSCNDNLKTKKYSLIFTVEVCPCALLS